MNLKIKILFLFILLFIIPKCNAQESKKFNGEIKTESIFIVKDSLNFSDAELEKLEKPLLTIQYFSDKYMKEVTVGEDQFYLYSSEQNKQFEKKTDNDTIFVIDYSKISNNISSIKTISNKTKILGYNCSLVSYRDDDLETDFEMYHTDEIQTSLDFKSNIDIYNIFKNNLILKMIIEGPSIRVIYTVTDIIPKKIDESIFEIDSTSIFKYVN